MISGGGDTMTAMFGQPSAELAAQLKSDEVVICINFLMMLKLCML